MKGTLSRNWPLYASILVFLLLVWLTLSVSIRQNHGHLVYALDDAYIHMAMAKNFSQSGVWGVTRYGFTPSSSSLLWTLLLSLTYYLGGVNQLAPLLWNLVFAILVLAVADAILSWYKTPAAIKFVALLGIIFLVPLPMLILSGMEQGLQTLLSMLAVFLAARLLSGESPGSARRDAVGLLILAPLVTARAVRRHVPDRDHLRTFPPAQAMALRFGLCRLRVSPRRSSMGSFPCPRDGFGFPLRSC